MWYLSNSLKHERHLSSQNLLVFPEGFINSSVLQKLLTASHGVWVLWRDCYIYCSFSKTSASTFSPTRSVFASPHTPEAYEHSIPYWICEPHTNCRSIVSIFPNLGSRDVVYFTYFIHKYRCLFENWYKMYPNADLLFPMPFKHSN